MTALIARVILAGTLAIGSSAAFSQLRVTDKTFDDLKARQDRFKVLKKDLSSQLTQKDSSSVLLAMTLYHEADKTYELLSQLHGFLVLYAVIPLAPEVAEKHDKAAREVVRVHLSQARSRLAESARFLDDIPYRTKSTQLMALEKELRSELKNASTILTKVATEAR